MYRHCISGPTTLQGYGLCRFSAYGKELTLTEWVVSGNFEVEFNISQDSERVRLQKFLEFMAMCLSGFISAVESPGCSFWCLFHVNMLALSNRHK